MGLNLSLYRRHVARRAIPLRQRHFKARDLFVVPRLRNIGMEILRRASSCDPQNRATDEVYPGVHVASCGSCLHHVAATARTVSIMLRRFYGRSDPRASKIVGLLTMGDPHDSCECLGVVQPIDDTVVSHTDAPQVLVAPQFPAAGRPGSLRQRQNLLVDSTKQSIVQFIKLLLCGRLDLKRESSHEGGCSSGVSPGTARRERFSLCGAIRPRGHPESPPK